MNVNNWVNKHKPNSSSDILGQVNGVNFLKIFVKNFSKNKKKGLIIYGPPGVGKTSSVYAVAKEFGLEVFELNASDFRNQNSISSLVGSSSKQKSLFSKGKVILIDEIDGISGTKDRGGVAALIKCMDDSFFPVVITANDPFSKKFSSLRKKCELIHFNFLSNEDVYSILKKVARVENVSISDEVLSSFVRRCNGDVRGALNDFQVLCSSKKTLSMEDVDLVSDRDSKVEIKDALLRIFKTTDFNVSFDTLGNSDNLDDFLLWFDENIPLEYSGGSLSRAFNCLSKADVFKGRIRRRQYWRFLVYMRFFLSSGISLSKDSKKGGVVSYKQPGRLLKLYWANIKNKRKKSIAEKLSSQIHCSIKDSFSLVPFVSLIVRSDNSIGETLDFSSEDINWLVSSADAFVRG